MTYNTVTLLENSIFFINEAILNSKRAKRHNKYWMFAILHLVQGLELLIKHALQLQHPIFIFENIDKKSGHTVSLNLGLERLKAIAGLEISMTDERAIKRANDQRNKIVHHEHVINPDYYQSIFVELFEFLHHFYYKHFGSELHDLIDSKLWRAEAELLSRFDSDWITYRGVRLDNGLPFEIIKAQQYTQVRQNHQQGYQYFYRERYDGLYGEICPDCGVAQGELHTSFCDIELCPICHNQLRLCLHQERCNVEYWIPKKGKGK